MNNGGAHAGVESERSAFLHLDDVTFCYYHQPTMIFLLLKILFFNFYLLLIIKNNISGLELAATYDDQVSYKESLVIIKC